jgi:hypothetical protein
VAYSSEPLISWNISRVDLANQYSYASVFRAADGHSSALMKPYTVGNGKPTCYYKKAAKTLPNIKLDPTVHTYIKALD